MATASRRDDLTIPELFHALKQRLSGIASNCICNSSGLDLREIISLQAEAAEVLSLVRGLRNFSSPVGRLPGEVLERILAMRGLERDLIAASRVCRHWRDTLMSSPHLWTKFQCVNVARTMEYLVRSKPVPINVIANFDSDIQTVIALKSTTDRFGSLTLRLEPFDLLQVFHHLTAPAPALEHLDITATPHSGDGPAFRPTIPATFLGGSTPTLKSLLLNGINTKLNFSEFPTLTHLTLITNVQIFDMSELFRVLISAKPLEEVSVQFSGPTTPIPEAQGAVVLPHMRKLKFSNTVGEFPKGLLPLLVMPSVEEVQLHISLPGEDTRTMKDFLPVQLRNFPHLLKVDHLKLDVPQAHCNIQFGGPGGVVSICALRSGNREQKEDFQRHWLNSLEPMSIAGVKDLTLRSYHPERPLGGCPVSKSLKTLDGLRSLVVERCNSGIVTKVLSPSKGDGILFPRLESLTLQLIMEPTRVFPDLTDMARARREAGFPLSKISSDRSTTFQVSDVERLQRYVDWVEFNTRIDSQSIDVPLRVVPSHLFKGSASSEEKPGAQMPPSHTPAGGLLSSSKRKNPLADLATVHSRR